MENFKCKKKRKKKDQVWLCEGWCFEELVEWMKQRGVIKDNLRNDPRDPWYPSTLPTMHLSLSLYRENIRDERDATAQQIHPRPTDCDRTIQVICTGFVNGTSLFSFSKLAGVLFFSFPFLMSADSKPNDETSYWMQKRHYCAVKLLTCCFIYKKKSQHTRKNWRQSSFRFVLKGKSLWPWEQDFLFVFLNLKSVAAWIPQQRRQPCILSRSIVL